MSTTRTRLFVVAFTVAMLFVIPGTAWGQLTATDDTYVSGAAPTTANGSVGSLVVQGSTTNKPSYSYIRFDLSSLGAVSSAQVQKATLRLYVSAVTVAGGFDVIEVTSPTGWAEGTLIYNTPGASTPSGTMLNISPISVPYPSGKYQYILVDVTPAVQHWLSGTQNNGLVLKPHDSSISVAFASKEDTTYSHDPALNVQLLSSSITGSITEAQVVGLTTDLGNLNVNVASRVPLSAVGAANGVAALDGTAHVPTTELPNTIVYNNQSNTFGAGLKQIFQSNGMAGLNFAAAPSNTNPGSLTAGDIWFRLDLKHLHFFDGSLTHQLMFRDDTIPGSQVVGNIAGSAGSIAGNIPESQVTNLTSDLGTLTTNLTSETSARQTADTTLQNNINSEAAARAAADTFEATARMTADVAEASARATADTALQSNINTETARATAAENGKASLAGNNTLTGSNTFTGPKVDLSGAGATLPVKTTTGTVPFSGSPSACVDGEMLMKVDGNPGQQLFICNPAHDGWVMVNDDTATTAADHAYTDTQVATEAAARVAGDTATLSSANAHADAGDATTLSSANAHSDAAVLAESVARAAGDAATLTSANTYTDAEKTRAMAAEALKANLAGGNIFTGGSQVLAPSDGAYASLNVPNSTTAPTTPGVGDVWLVNLDPHLNFRDMNNATQMLAFFSDITTANSNTLTSAHAYTDTQVATEAAARVAGDTATLSSANAHADAGDASILASANSYTNTAVATESAARLLGDAATLASADAYTDGQVATINTSLAGKANLAGGNSFTGNQSITGNTSITGNETVSGLLTLPAAAPGNSQPSNALQLNATDNTGTSQSAQLQAFLDGSLSFQFGPTAGPISQKLSIAPTGVITFAPGQTFPGTNNGTVTQINTGVGLTGGPINTTGTISLSPNGVTAGAYTKVTVDQYGRTTSGTTLSSTDIPNIAESQVTNLTTDLANEAAARIAGDTAAVASANAYTDGQVAGKATLSGNNSFSGNQSITGNLSVTGTDTVNGTLSLPATAAATSGTPASSNALDLIASSFSGSAVNEKFRWQAEGNGSSNAGSLNLLFGSGANTPGETGLSIDNTGKITFAGGQTFPGTNNGTVTNITTTGPITGGPITTTGTITCATCVTSAASLTGNAVMIGGGSQGSATIAADTTTTHALFATAGAPAFRPIASGDIPSLSGTYVDLTSTQTVGGAKTLSGADLVTGSLAPSLTGTITATTAGNVTGTVGTLNGGTGINSAPTAAGQYLRSNGIGTWSINTIQTGDLPSLSGTYVDLASAQTITGTKTFNSTSVFGVANGTGGLLIPVSAAGAQKPSFPLDMEATNTGGTLHLFRIIGQEGTTPNWTFQFCNSAPCTPTSNGFSIAGLTGALTAPSITDSGLTSGNCVQTSTNGLLTTTGAPCASGSGNVTGSSLTSGQLIVGSGGSAIAIGNLSGDVTTSNSTATTLANSGVTAGTYTKLTVDAKGRATVGATAAASDLSNGITGTGLIALATSPALAGTPTAPTPATADSSTKIATTAYVQAQGYLNSAVTSFNGVAGAVTGVSSVTAAATNPGLTVAGTSSNPTVAMTTAQRTRNICYIAGADNPTAPTLTTSDSQQTFFHNLIGPMSVANTLGAVWCQTNANTASINLSDGGTNFFGAPQSCTATGVNLTPNAISILAGDNLNFSIAANPAAGTTRITVCIAAAVN